MRTDSSVSLSDDPLESEFDTDTSRCEQIQPNSAMYVRAFGSSGRKRAETEGSGRPTTTTGAALCVLNSVDLSPLRGFVSGGIGPRASNRTEQNSLAGTLRHSVVMPVGRT